MNCRSIRSLVLLLGLCGALASAAPSAAVASSGDILDVYDQVGADVAQKLLDSPALQSKSGSGKVRIVIGDVVNDSDNYGIRVEDIFNQIRDKLVSSGLVRLYAPGELDVDFIIAPQLTSRRKDGRHECYTLNLTITAPSGEYIASMSAERCD